MSASKAFRAHTSQKNLRRQLRNSVPASQGIGLDGIHPGSIDSWDAKEINDLARQVSDSLRNGNYRFTSYRQGLALRGADRTPRVFAIPTIRDRLALSALKGTLHDVYKLSGPEPPQRKVAKLVSELDKGVYSHYIKLDLRDYFGQIRRDNLTRKLERDIRSSNVLDLLDRAIRNSTVPFGERSRGLDSGPDGIPLGISISSALAEIYLEDFDRSVDTNHCFFRYVDDILVLSSGALDAQKLLINPLKRLGLEVHPAGTAGKHEVGQISDGFAYLGYEFNGTVVSIDERAVRRIERRLARLIAQAAKVARKGGHPSEVEKLLWHLDLTIGGCIIDGTARGWIRYFNRSNDLTTLGRLDGLVESLLKRHSLAPNRQPKRFVSAFWSSRDNDKFRAYAFDFDRVTEAEARLHLEQFEGLRKSEVDGMSSNEALAAYRRQVRRYTIDLERDLEPAS
ncbi:MAG: hypothetical protein EOO23_03895 [Comamonadaceae bacterium]|nr:MAG: hypothetical protein EOO23_03895 [Comamonadaceae bacterium]